MEPSPQPQQLTAHGPQSSDLTPTPAEKRDRACERCWRRKQKCDRMLPACTACTALGLRCQARRSEQASDTPEDGGGTITAESVPSYVEALKRKICQLEEEQRSGKRRRVSSSRNREEGLSPESAARPRSATPANSAQNSAEGSVYATMGQIGFLSRSAMAEPHDGEGARDIHCRLAPEKLVGAAVARTTLNTSLLHLPGFTPADAGVQSLSLAHQNTVGFIDRFLDDAPTLLLIHLDDDQLKQQYGEVMHDHVAGKTTGSINQHAPRDFGVYMSIAIGAALSPNSARLESFSKALHAACMAMFPSLIRSSDSLTYIHCLLYLIVYSTLNASGGSTWYLLGLAVSKCISAGLHKDPDMNAGISEACADSRRRTFWSLYLIDRLLSTVMDRPFAIQDYDISVQDPTEGSSDKEALIHHLVMHAKLISHFRRNNDGPPIRDYHNFLYWQQLPSPVRRLAEKSPAISHFLHRLSFRTSAQFLQPLQLAERPSIAAAVHKLEADAMSHCRLFIDELHAQLDADRFSGSLFDIFDIFSAGIVILYLTELPSTAATPTQTLIQATKSVNKCCNLLTTIGERFPQSRMYRKALFSLLDRIIDMDHSDQQDIDLPDTVSSQMRLMVNFLLTRGVSA